MSILKQSSKQKDIADLSGLDLLKLANSIFDKISNLKDGYNLSDLINEFPILRSTLDSYKENHPDKSDVEMIFLLLRKAEKKGHKRCYDYHCNRSRWISISTIQLYQ